MAEKDNIKDLINERSREVHNLLEIAKKVKEELKAFLEIFRLNGDEQNAEKSKKIINSLEVSIKQHRAAFNKLDQAENKVIQDLLK